MTAIPTEALPLPGGREGAGVRVHPLRTANMLAPPAFLQRPAGPAGLDERLVPLFVDDQDAYVASLDRLIALSGEADHVVCGHDPDGLRRADGVFA